ncbi:LLM class F420-dependent oxidoreductase [Flavisphingomonas formosensis]|uniref:LLM class F420-dependent oxidoreductase n=1 Tax=Flavisphingomonas formosensis TaxID=861534 RepID=UPI0018DFE171|nr:LLM class F420-dependent oxidoreductase [Sphingomonas formosensis]
MVRIGAILPQLEIAPDPETLRRWVVAVEEMGFDHLVVYDHVVGADVSGKQSDPRMQKWPAGHYNYRDLFHEPLVLLGYLAAVTRKIELSTGILILPQRQTTLVAKQAAEIQVLSGNRLRLGVGIGYNHLEFEALGVPFARRGDRMGEQIDVLRELWGHELVDIDKPQHRFGGVGLNPLPSQPIPLWLGATSAIGFDRVVRQADGWICPGGALSPAVQGWLAQLDEALGKAPPRERPLGMDGRLDMRYRADDELAREAARWRELGATHISVNTMAPYNRRAEKLDVDEHLAMLRHALELIRG